VEGKPKSADDQLREIEKLVADATRLLEQAQYAVRTLAERLKEQPGRDQQR
jgi:uncharacterized coiled-coil protein SlyX